MARRGGFQGGMPGNMNNLMKQAQKMQKQMEETTKALEEKTYEASAGGGVVKVTVSGKKEIVMSYRIGHPSDVRHMSHVVSIGAAISPERTIFHA